MLISNNTAARKKQPALTLLQFGAACEFRVVFFSLVLLQSTNRVFFVLFYIWRARPYLVDLAVVQLDGAEGARGEAAGLELAAIGGLLAVRVQVFPQIDEILAAKRKGGRNRAAGRTLWVLFGTRLGEKRALALTCSRSSRI